MNKTTWVERFRKQFGITPNVESFIASELQQQRREIVEMIEGMKKPFPELSERNKSIGITWDSTSWAEAGGEEITGYNDCIDDIIKKVGKHDYS